MFDVGRWFFRGVLGVLMMVCMAVPAWADAEKADAARSVESATLRVFNRDIITFRSAFLGQTPAVRAARSKSALTDYLRQGGEHKVSVKENPVGKMVMLGPNLVFIITSDDVDVLTGENLEMATQQAVRRLEQVIGETQESRDMGKLLRALAIAGVASVIYVLLLLGVGRLRRWVERRLVAIAERKAQALTIAGQSVLETHALLPRLQQLIDLLRWFIVALLTYEWVSFVLSCFPYTRPWSEQLNAYLYDLFATVAEAMVDALPGLILAATIFLIARFFANLGSSQKTENKAR